MKSNNLIIAGLLFAAGTVVGSIELTEISETKSSPSVTQNPAPVVTAQPTEPEEKKPEEKSKTSPEFTTDPKHCVFKTAFEGEGLDNDFFHPIPQKVMTSMQKGLDWIDDAQQNDGGWGAGSNRNQGIKDPHAVKSDPATTAMVAMALQRCGNNLQQGSHSKQLNKALEFLLEAVENTPRNSSNITTLTYTQPQSKLGQNIDVVLTSQFLSNILSETENDPALKNRVTQAIQKCVAMIENNHNADGSLKGSGWAGVLQSSFATSALESAQSNGITVNEEVIEKSRDFQKGNMDVKTNSVATESAAGVVLYSVSGSARASAKETREAKEILKKAKKEGKIQSEDVTVSNLKNAGLPESTALKYETAYQVNKSAQKLAQDDNVISGFGNNGGEEFLSYLQTGEGMIISKDDTWQNWYDKTSARMLQIQNNDGSWSGHHCITSPVFCTATCLLILSVNNDINKLTGNYVKKNID